MASANPERFMRRAVQLSKRGYPAPNPRVGCVIVKGGEIVGEGWHPFAGGLHAEAMALEAAGERARGAEVYVTLEPCNHIGRQPACAAALVRAGVARIAFACKDRNPRVEGGGAAFLSAAGISVEEGLLADEAAAANRPWMESMRLKRPFVTLKAAQSLDGRIALPNGESKWITGEAARREARRLRAEMGAVLVGKGTVLKDDPALTARLSGVRNPPMRIVLDPERDLPSCHRVFQEDGASLRVVRHARAHPGDLAIDYGPEGFRIDDLLAALWERGITGVLVEGGSQTLSSFLAAGCADRLALFTGNVILGRGLPWVEAQLLETLQEAMRWRLVTLKRLGNDVLMKFDAVDAGIDRGCP